MKRSAPRLAAALSLLALSASPALAQRRVPTVPCPPAAGPTSDECVRYRLVGLEEYVARAMEAWKVPGLSVAVVRGSRIVYERGFGVRELGRPEPVDEHTVFAVASNSKALTAASLARLVDEGRISWDTRVASVLPDLRLYSPYVTSEVTLRDLLSHRTGYETWGGDLLWYGSTLTKAQVLERIRHVPPVTSFRSSWGYSNLMFHVAGSVVEAVTDTSWNDYVAAHFVRPLGMTRTTTSLGAMEALGNVARPHTLVDGRVAAVPFRPLDAAPAAAAFNSSAHDWARWLMLNVQNGTWQGRRLVSERNLKELRQMHSLRRISPAAQRSLPSMHVYGYGLGWDLRDYRGRYVVSHTGGMDGMVSQTGFVPEDSVGVVVLTNFDEAPLYSSLFWDVLDRVMAGERSQRSLTGVPATLTPDPAPPRTPGTQPSLPLAAYAGQYRHPMLGTATVSLCEGEAALCVAFEHHPGLRGRLAHWHHDVFEARWADPYFRTSLLPFDLDRDGTPIRFRVQVRPDFVDPMDYPMERVR